MDERRRKLERSATQGDRAAAVEVLRQRLRAGDLNAERLDVLVLFGDEVAAEALGRSVPAWPTTGKHQRREQTDRLSRCGTDVLARVGAALAHAAFALVDDDRARTAANAIDDWVLCPSDEHAERAERAGADGAERAVEDANDDRAMSGADCVVAVALGVSRQRSMYGRTQQDCAACGAALVERRYITSPPPPAAKNTNRQQAPPRNRPIHVPDDDDDDGASAAGASAVVTSGVAASSGASRVVGAGDDTTGRAMGVGASAIAGTCSFLIRLRLGARPPLREAGPQLRELGPPLRDVLVGLHRDRVEGVLREGAAALDLRDEVPVVERLVGGSLERLLRVAVLIVEALDLLDVLITQVGRPVGDGDAEQREDGDLHHEPTHQVPPGSHAEMDTASRIGCSTQSCAPPSSHASMASSAGASRATIGWCHTPAW